MPMMNLGQTLAYLYPDADPGTDYTVRLGEDGELHISEWNLDAPQPTPAELEAASLEAAKAMKTDEFAARPVEDLAPLFTDGQGRDELVFVLAVHVRRICDALGVQADPRLESVETVGEKALAKRDEVVAATSPEEVERVEWT